MDKGNPVTVKGLIVSNQGIFATQLTNVVLKEYSFVPTKGLFDAKKLNAVPNKLNYVTNKGLVAPNQGCFAAKLIKFEPDKIKEPLNQSHLRFFCPICEPESPRNGQTSAGTM